MIAAVITADIVNSTRLEAGQATVLRHALEGTFSENQLEFFRGDSFQLLVRKPAAALRLALQARSLARSLGTDFDIRCSIGIGKYEGPVKSLSTASGESFLLSGRAFDSLADNRRLAIVSSTEDRNQTFRILAAYCDHLFRALTAKQASVVYELLTGKTQIEAGAQLKVTQATVSSHAQSAGWTEIEYLLTEYEALCASFNK